MFRILIGIIAVALLLLGAFLLLFRPDANPAYSGMMIRVGTMMAVIWLAAPQLESFKGRIPAIMIGVALLCLAFLAAKPNIGKVLIAVVAIAISVGAVLKWMTKMADGNQRPKQ